MAREKKRFQATDRERILMNVITLSQFDSILGNSYKRGEDAYFKSNQNPKVGDLVYCHTGRCHIWKVAWVIETHPSSYGGQLLLREVGGERLTTMDNESYSVIDTRGSAEFFEGKQRAFYLKLVKAMGEHEYEHRFFRLEFPEPGRALLTVRRRWEDNEKYTVALEWVPKTTIKAIREQLDAKKYGDDHMWPYWECEIRLGSAPSVPLFRSLPSHGQLAAKEFHETVPAESRFAMRWRIKDRVTGVEKWGRWVAYVVPDGKSPSWVGDEKARELFGVELFPVQEKAAV